jgi:hypothetical protein
MSKTYDGPAEWYDLGEFAARFDIDEVVEPGAEDYPILLAFSGRSRGSSP